MLVRDVIRELKKCNMDAEVQVLKIVPSGQYEQTTYDFEKLRDIDEISSSETGGYVQLSA